LLAVSERLQQPRIVLELGTRIEFSTLVLADIISFISSGALQPNRNLIV